MISSILATLIWFFSRSENIEFYNKLEFEGNNFVINQTNYNYIDTVIYAGLDELNITNTYVVVKEMDELVSKNFKNENDLILQAAIVGTKNQYIIYVTPMNRVNTITIISHELVHLKQYADGRLKMIDNGIEWNGVELNINNLSQLEYSSRPWEREAFQVGKILSNKLKNVLYND
jgi:hypothetical protein